MEYFFFSLSTMEGCNKKTPSMQRRPSSDTKSTSALILDFPVSGSVMKTWLAKLV
uniref:Uncharacterized protein n=1 Tax=Sciurus vulgaris TaxID=55149 RepID=A0A8D2DW03_SCIVU